MHNICSLKYIVSKKIPIVFHNGFNMIIILSQKSWQKNLKTIHLFKREYLKTHNLYSSSKKKNNQEYKKMENKLQQIYFTYYNLLIVQDLWQANYQILSIILLKEFTVFHSIKCKYRHDNKKWHPRGIKYRHCDCFLGIQILKMI